MAFVILFSLQRRRREGEEEEDEAEEEEDDNDKMIGKKERKNRCGVECSLKALSAFSPSHRGKQSR